MHDHKYHYVYRISRFDGAYYIGIHSTNDLNDGYFGSGVRLKRSIKKHGIDKHRKVILEFLRSREALQAREKELINEETLADPSCLNLANGGYGNWAYANKTGRNLYGLNGQNLGRYGQITLQRRRKDPKFDRDYRNKIHVGLLTSEKFKRYLVSNDHLDKMKRMQSASQTEEAMIKRKESYRKIGHQQGTKNSMYGMKWITDGKINKIILASESVPFGWTLGRFVKIRAAIKPKDRSTNVEKRRLEIRKLFDQFLSGNYASLRDFHRKINYEFSFVALTLAFKKFIPEYAKVKRGKSFTGV